MTGIRKIHDFDDEKIKEMKSSYLWKERMKMNNF